MNRAEQAGERASPDMAEERLIPTGEDGQLPPRFADTAEAVNRAFSRLAVEHTPMNRFAERARPGQVEAGSIDSKLDGAWRLPAPLPKDRKFSHGARKKHSLLQWLAGSVSGRN